MRSSGVNALAVFSIDSLSGCVGALRSRRVEDRVVVAAAKLERHGARHRGRDPARERLLEHERFRVVPPALVEQAAEPPTEREVEVGRVLVVHRRLSSRS